MLKFNKIFFLGTAIVFFQTSHLLLALPQSPKLINMKDSVLIVDSETLINKFLESRLTKEELDVDIAFDGIEAEKKINEREYDLILTDLILPYVAGVELIMKIKKSAHNSQTPIIVLSSLSAEDIIVDVLAIGAQDYIVKPFSINVVLAKIKQLIQLKRSAA